MSTVLSPWQGNLLCGDLLFMFIFALFSLYNGEGVFVWLVGCVCVILLDCALCTFDSFLVLSFVVYVVTFVFI